MIFVAVFVPGGSRHPHAHDDLLSYTVYHAGEELIVDPGRPTYTHHDRHYSAGRFHSGLHLIASIAPRPSVLTPTSFCRPEISETRRPDGGFEVEARNARLRGWKRLELTLEPEGSLAIRESVGPVSQPGASAFGHCFANPSLEQTGPRTVRANALQIEYIGPASIEIRKFERATEYGERRPCSHVTTAAAPGSSICTRIRNV